MDWNPTAPDVLGLEFPVRNEPGVGPSFTVASQMTAVAQTMTSTVAETIGSLADLVSGGGNPYAYISEVFDFGSEIPQNVATQTFRPNGSAAVTSDWHSTSVTFHDAISGAVLDPAKYVYLSTAGASKFAAGSFELEFPTAGALVGKRITAVRLCFKLAVETVGGGNRTINLSISAAGQPWGGATATGGDSAANAIQTTLDSGEIDRVTVQPWTVASVQAMDGAGYRFKFYGICPANPTGATPSTCKIFQVWLEVEYADENRKHTRLVQGTNTTPLLVTYDVRTPTGGTSWAKPAFYFTKLLRQPSLGNIGHFSPSVLFSVPYLRGIIPSPIWILVNPAVHVDSQGRWTDGGDQDPYDIITSKLTTTGGVTSVNSQPYAETVAVQVAGTVEQEIESTSAVEYTGVAFPALVDGLPDDLTVNLRRRSDDTLMATGVLTVDEWTDATVEPEIGAWRLVQCDFAAPAALAAATQYYVEFTSGGVGSWYIQGLWTHPRTGVLTSNGIGTYGGSTDVATYGGADVPGADLALMVLQPVAAPEDVTVTALGCS